VSNGDRGGNCVPVTIAFANPPEAPVEDPRHNWRPNLHAVWDEGLINHIMAANKLADSRAFADYLLQQAPHPSSEHRPTTDRVTGQRRTAWCDGPWNRPAALENSHTESCR
jgi:hypothetical protein